MRAKHWRQGSPKDQSVQILSGIEGWLLMLEDGSKPERVLAFILPMLKDLRKLQALYLPDEWAPDSEASPEALAVFQKEMAAIVDEMMAAKPKR